MYIVGLQGRIKMFIVSETLTAALGIHRRCFFGLFLVYYSHGHCES